MFGWQGKLAKIDLESGECRVETPDPEILRKFIGGRGLAGHFLRDHATLRWDDPGMPLMFFTGPLVNTASPTSGRMTVMSRSPLTGTAADSSVGGSFGRELKKAGFDGVIVTGKGDSLRGIEISNGGIEIVPADHLAGMKTGNVAKRLKGKGATAVIGPAAENGVRFSSIIVDGHFAAGRNGLGLVFASKNLKYITAKGAGKTAVFDRDELKKACGDILRLVSASPVISGEFGISRFGTGALYDLMDARMMMPTNNFLATRFGKAASMNAWSYVNAYRPAKAGCKGCHIQCKKKSESGLAMPEFETMSHFSALLGNDDKDAVMAANRVCNEMGMDTISAAVTLACHAEIQGKKLTSRSILALLSDIGEKRGMGEALGRGSAKYAAERGKPETAMAVKGQELPAYDPRGAYGMSLAYALSTRGGCHLRAYPISHEILRKPVATDRFSFEGKARIIKIGEDINAAADSLTACKFVFFAASLEEYARVFTAATGVEMSGHDLLRIGERIVYNERIMNAANGFSSDHDDIPGRFFESPGYSEGPVRIGPIDRRAFLKARANYYSVRGLDENGRPLPEKIRELGL